MAKKKTTTAKKKLATKPLTDAKKEVKAIGTDIGCDDGYTKPQHGHDISMETLDDILDYITKKVPSGKFAFAAFNGKSLSCIVSGKNSHMEAVYIADSIKKVVDRINS